MNKSSNFSIKVCGHLIEVDLQGDWSEQDDLSYVSLLSEKIIEVKNNSWGILVDMRGWKVQEVATLSKFKIALDRRNQKLECWIVDDMQQGEFLLTHFKNTLVNPVRLLDPTAAQKYLEEAGFSLLDSEIFKHSNHIKSV